MRYSGADGSFIEPLGNRSAEVLLALLLVVTFTFNLKIPAATIIGDVWTTYSQPERNV